MRKDEWDTKEGIGKSMKKCIVRMYSGVTKGTSWAEAMSNNKKTSP